MAGNRVPLCAHIGPGQNGLNLIALEQAHIATRVFSGQCDAMLLKKGLERKYRRDRSVIDSRSCPIQHDGSNMKWISHPQRAFPRRLRRMRPLECAFMDEVYEG